MEFSHQAIATTMPPKETMTPGPKRSANQPSTGTSQVSVATKIVKAIWMSVRPQ
jgi:hypothetical protein